jgi:hypothetical protein
MFVLFMLLGIAYVVLFLYPARVLRMARRGGGGSHNS